MAYVGHSQGTTQFFALTALRPDYNEKIAAMVALAPIAYMGHMSTPLVKLLTYHMDIVQVSLLFITFSFVTSKYFRH